MPHGAYRAPPGACKTDRPVGVAPLRWLLGKSSGAAAAVGLFLVCTVGLATLVTGWAAPAGIALGVARWG